MRILVDSSVWVDFFKGQISREVKTLKDAIIQGDDVYLSPTILQEVLQGFKHEQDYRLARELLMTFPVLTWDPIELAIDAAQIYRNSSPHAHQSHGLAPWIVRIFRYFTTMHQIFFPLPAPTSSGRGGQGDTRSTAFG